LIGPQVESCGMPAPGYFGPGSLLARMLT